LSRAQALLMEEENGPAAASHPPAATPRFTPEESLDDQIRDLEAWARAIVRRNTGDSARFWILRGLAFCAAALAATTALQERTNAVVILSALAALCIALEAGWPGASVRNVHRRAIHDLREVQSTVKLRWHKVLLAHPDPSSRKRVAYALELLELIHAKREEVGKYLGSAEPNPGIRRSS
jgi:hypothetical protein